MPDGTTPRLCRCASRSGIQAGGSAEPLPQRAARSFAPDDRLGFDQRFSATLGDDRFDGVFQLAETPGDWQDDMTITYGRRD